MEVVERSICKKKIGLEQSSKKARDLVLEEEVAVVAHVSKMQLEKVSNAIKKVEKNPPIHPAKSIKLETENASYAPGNSCSEESPAKNLGKKPGKQRLKENGTRYRCKCQQQVLA